MSVFKQAYEFIGSFFEEIVLLGIILLNVLDFFGALNPDFDYLKKIVSLSAVCYLIYRAELSEVLFGVPSKAFDSGIILSYLMLGMKNVIALSRSVLSEMQSHGAQYWAVLKPVDKAVDALAVSSPVEGLDLTLASGVPVGTALDTLAGKLTILPGWPPAVNQQYVSITNEVTSSFYLVESRFLFHRWHNLILDNSFLIQKIGLVAGLVMLLVLAFLVVRRAAGRPSLLDVLRNAGPPPDSHRKLCARAMLVFLLLVFFYVAVFNLTMEWLALAIDAPLIVVAIFFYLMVWLKHHRRFNAEGFIYRVGSFGEGFYRRFISLFHSRDGLLLGISGMLVLHLLTDLGVFMVPYLTGLTDTMYLGELGAGHMPVLSINDLFSAEKESLLFIDLAASSGIYASASLVFLYFMNLIGMVTAFLGPALIWYLAFVRRPMALSRSLLGLFYGSMLCLLLVPAFSLGRISSGSLVGVDVQTHSVAAQGLPVEWVALASLACIASVYLASRNSFLERLAARGAVLIVLLFFAAYIYNYFVDIIRYYYSSLAALYAAGELVFASCLGLMLAATVVFYAGGLVAYTVELLTGSRPS